MSNMLPHTDEGWLKFFQSIYTVALVITVLATILINRYASRIASGTTLQVAEANKVAALANQRAEELERENLEIRKQMADRLLIDPERKMLVTQIRTQGHQIKVTRIGDPEAQRYADMIASAFTEAGWGVDKSFRTPHDPDSMPKGIICRVSKSPDSVVTAVIKALPGAGINFTIEEVQGAPSFIEIVVGSKPK